MRFEDFIKEGTVRKAERDEQLINSVLNTADTDIEFLSGLKVTAISARKIVSNYYDVMREILEALAINDGYKVYSHEAFTYFLKERYSDALSIKFDRFRKLRNKINYYGTSISVDEALQYKDEIISIIAELREKLLK